MIHTFTTLFRAKSHEAAEAFTDANAATILRQQIRDAAQAIKTARQSVAMAMAHHEQEKRHYQQIVGKIENLETRACAAIQSGQDELAQQAAAAIVTLEDEKATSQTALNRYEKEISRLREQVQKAQSTLRNLQRGERLVSATENTRALQKSVANNGSNALQDAQETLARLERRNENLDLARAAEQQIEEDQHPQSIEDRLAEAGCGAPLKSSADQVLERLRAQSKATEPAKRDTKSDAGKSGSSKKA
ncbi:MAG: PspA/IM30 family protein [Pseudomonadota bacterium]